MTAIKSPEAIQAQLVAEVGLTLTDQAKKLRAIGMDASNQNTSAALMRLVDRVRRAALIAETVLSDLQNEARRADLENDAPLPLDPNGSLGGTVLPNGTTLNAASAITNPLSAPLFLQDQPPPAQ